MPDSPVPLGTDSTQGAYPVESRPFASSPQIDKIAGALATAQGEFPPIEKDKTADTGKFSYDYADLSTILKATSPILSKHGLAVSQPPSTVTASGVVIKTILLHASGQWMADVLTMPVVDPRDPQKVGSSISYGRRYAYCGMVGIQPADEDDDGRAAQATPTGRKPARPAATSRQAARPEPEPASEPESSKGAGDERITLTGDGGGQKGRLLAILREHRVDLKQFGTHLIEKYGYKTWAEIRQRDYDAIVSLAQAWPHPAGAERDPGQEG